MKSTRTDSPAHVLALTVMVALVLTVALLGAGPAWAQKRATHGAQSPARPQPAASEAPAKSVTIASLGSVDPWRWVEESGALEKATGYRIEFRRFGDSGEAVRAMAAGGIQIAELGSAGVATAASEGMDYQLFWILEDIAAAEALVARNGTGITDVAALKGHRVATPFVSTSHYQLLYALDRAGIALSDLTLVNLHPDEIAKAWSKGTIDAAFVWDPVLATLLQSGQPLLTSGELCAQGACTFDGLVVDPGFAKANPAFMNALVKAIAAADADYRAHPGAWGAGSDRASAIAKWTGAAPGTVAASLARYRYPDLAQQASTAWLGGGAQSGA
ncbi:MAG: PhnD/SsuA/transferrin family substrate-binding protein, partial [Casimicrobiaceae bacterium]